MKQGSGMQFTGGIELSEDDLKKAKGIIEKNKKRDNSNVKPMLQHCLCQMIRISQDEVNREKPEKLAQFGLNLGRAQELIESVGGVNYWWRRFEPLIVDKKWDEIATNTRNIIEELGLPEVTDEITSNKCMYE